MLTSVAQQRETGIRPLALWVAICGQSFSFAFHRTSFLPVWLKCECPQRQFNAFVDRADWRRKPVWSLSGFRLNDSVVFPGRVVTNRLGVIWSNNVRHSPNSGRKADIILGPLSAQ
jgi:hypothetical protein